MAQNSDIYPSFLDENCPPEYNGIPHWKNKSLDDIPGELWRQIPGWEDLYEASNMGRIKSVQRTVNNKPSTKKSHSYTRRTIIRSQCLDGSGGYLCITLTRNSIGTTVKVHILIGRTWIPNPLNKRTLNHKRGNKLDNRAPMLEWNTYGENHEHSYRELGRVHSMKGRMGYDNKKSKEIICTTTGIKYSSSSEAGRLLNIPFQNISKVCKGKRPRAHGLVFKFINE